MWGTLRFRGRIGELLTGTSQGGQHATAEKKQKERTDIEEGSLEGGVASPEEENFQKGQERGGISAHSGPEPEKTQQGAGEEIGPLVLVEWLDSYGCSSDWQEIAGIKPEPLSCRSVGWIAYQDEHCLVIVPHVSAPHNELPRQACGDMTIPAVSVLRITELSGKQARALASLQGSTACL